VVGGFVRDWLLDRQTADIDIAVGGDALNIAQEAARAVDGRYMLLDEANRVVIADKHLWHHAKRLVVLDGIR
jgi:tRNA nucleotidyltransferase/poly(A) polymerase